jgi:hypothetical protein
MGAMTKFSGSEAMFDYPTPLLGSKGSVSPSARNRCGAARGAAYNHVRLEDICVPVLPVDETVVHDLRSRLVGRRMASVAVGDLPLRKLWSAEWALCLNILAALSMGPSTMR